ncbi:MAG TPA: hypothetical protein VNF24_09255 [Candidatus Acidoferrales bacterium]|nr:hypothetical protein [Candidatus Acidoferrales bacterium]HVC38797.1 hypothetical protein [Candidatus Dormibacteraeota bacterium]
MELPAAEWLGQDLAGVLLAAEVAAAVAATTRLGVVPAALAGTSISEATPKPSPLSPAAAAPIRSNRRVIRFMAETSLAALPRSLLSRAGWPQHQYSAAA